jgi:hypothetical protein
LFGKRWSSATQAVDDVSEFVHVVAWNGDVREPGPLTQPRTIVDDLLHADQ